MENKQRRWGVFAWSRTKDGGIEARINNTFTCEQEAIEAAESTDFRYGYDSKVIVPEEHFMHAWAMIGAIVGLDEEASR